MEQEGVTEWIDYYEPGEGVQSARSKLRQGKQQAMKDMDKDMRDLTGF